MPDDKNTLLELYRKMVTIRQFETMAGEHFAAGEIPGFIHLSIGQEASSVGVCSCLREDDYVVTTHRGHGHMIAKGADLKRMTAELFGKRDRLLQGQRGLHAHRRLFHRISRRQRRGGRRTAHHHRRGPVHQAAQDRPGGAWLFSETAPATAGRFTRR